MTLWGSWNSERKIWPSGCARTACAISEVSSRICSTSGLSAATSASTMRAPGVGFELAGAPGWCAAEPVEQLAGRLAPAVVVARQPLRQALVGQRARVDGRRVTLQERERDRAVEIAEDHGRSGPEALQLSAQLVAQRHALLDQQLAPACERPERLGPVAVGHQLAEAMRVGAREFAQHERVEAVGLTARGTKPRAGRGDLVGMQCQHGQPSVEQPLDQQPVGALKRDALDPQAHQFAAQTRQPRLVVRDRRRPQPFSLAIGHDHVVGVLGPVHPGAHARSHRAPPGHRSLDASPTGSYRCGCS